MKISKKLLVFSLAASLTISPFMVSASNEEKAEDLVSTEIEVINERQEQMKEYIEYRGKIVEAIKDEKINSIFVKDNEEDPMNGEVYHITDKVIILDAENKKIVDGKDLKKGMTVTTYNHKNTPVTLSIPAQSVPSVIVINQDEDTGFIDVDKFDEELVNTENTLKVILSEETIMIDQAGKEVKEDDLKNRDLIVFYSASTKSIPAQVVAEKIILIKEKEEPVDEDQIKEIKVLDKILLDGKEIKLEKELYNNEEEMAMIPLRQISEALGYEVEWKNETRSVELKKGAQWTSLTIGEDNYNFAKMLVKLGAAPELKDATTFVPVTFLEEVLKQDIEITESGMISLIK